MRSEYSHSYKLRAYEIVFIDSHNIERNGVYHEYSEYEARKEARKEGAIEIISVRVSK